MTYKEFLERKIDIAPLSGIEIDPAGWTVQPPVETIFCKTLPAAAP